MATNLSIIKRAMKKLHVLPSETEPNNAEAFDGMAILQSLIVELIGQGSLGRLNDVLATTDYTAFENDRIRAANGVTITLQTTITTEPIWSLYVSNSPTSDYGFSCSTLPRPPRNMAPVVIVGTDYNVGATAYTAKTTWIYDAYTGAWVNLNSLTQQGAFPFADHFEDGFACLLAERWVDDWAGGEVGAETKRGAGVCRLMLSMRTDSQHTNAVGTYF